MGLIFILTGLIGIFMIILIPVCLFLSIKGTLISRKIKNEGNDQNTKFTKSYTYEILNEGKIIQNNVKNFELFVKMKKECI